MDKFDVVIIGGGASGAMCALSANKNLKIAIVDNLSFPAKKLLVTGNGRCNLTNLNTNSKYYNQDIEKYLEKFDVQNTLSFFEQLGLIYKIDDENRVYPLTNSAKTVVDVIFNELKKRNVFMFCEHNLQKIEKKDCFFEIVTDKNVVFAKKVVVAAGGGFDFSKLKMDIRYKQFTPSLCALKTNSTKRLSGHRLSEVCVSYEENKQYGEVLFKDSGLSGICVFNLSAKFARQNNFKGKVCIDIFPNIEQQTLKQILVQRKNIVEEASDICLGLLEKVVAKEILWRNHINETKPAKDLTEQEIENICSTIKSFDFDLCGNYDNNQVFSGGVALFDLTENLEHKTYKNLYFCGEVCDVDGECGGYNLQWAWTSGHIVGENL